MPQASRYQASVLRLGTPAPSTISPNAADQRREPSALVVMVSDTGSPVAVSRNNCVSPSPGSVPGTWKPLAIPVILGGAPGLTSSVRIARSCASVELGSASGRGRVGQYW